MAVLLAGKEAAGLGLASGGAPHPRKPTPWLPSPSTPLQVIKSELFDQNLLALIGAVNRRWGVGLSQ